MFRSSSEGQYSDGPSSSSLRVHGVPSPGSASQESSWIGLLSVVSRPALSFLHKYLPGRARPSALCDSRVDLIGGGLKSFEEEEREFLRQLEELVPLPPHAPQNLRYLRRHHGGPAACGAASWTTAECLGELGIHDPEEPPLDFCGQCGGGSPSPSRTLLSHVWLNSVSSQEVPSPRRMDWGVVGSSVQQGGGKCSSWWGSLWGAKETSEKVLLSGLSQAEDRTLAGWVCPPQLFTETKGRTGETNCGWTRGETTGATVQDKGVSMPDQLTSTWAAPPSSDPDIGYYSLEEHHQVMVKAQGGEEDTGPAESISVGVLVEKEQEVAEEGCSPSGRVGKEDEMEEAGQPVETGAAPAAPRCQNKTIAFIMGCPCSDDDSSQSESSDDDDDDDDGFDSEGSSDLSDSTDEDDDDDATESEADPELERLWSTLCQSSDPYNPQNFTARQYTGSTQPRPVPKPTTPPSSTQSSPATPPGLAASTPPSAQDVWEDSTSSSEVDEAENSHLWRSFSCSSDPYSLSNFQAPLRTQGPTEVGPKVRAKNTSQISPGSSNHGPAPPPEQVKEGEERLDSGFCGRTPSSRKQSCRSIKKVRFQDEVEEFFFNCGEEDEDRKGPWEEFARDRCRFGRRCLEVEQSIAYCLQPEHRRRVFSRRAVLWVQDQ